MTREEKLAEFKLLSPTIISMLPGYFVKEVCAVFLARPDDWPIRTCWAIRQVIRF